MSKILEAFVKSPELIPPGNFPAVIPSGLAELFPKAISCGMVLKKKLSDRIQRHSPVNCIWWWPFTQPKLSVICRTGVLRPCGRFVETMLGSNSVPFVKVEKESGTITDRKSVV